MLAIDSGGMIVLDIDNPPTRCFPLSKDLNDFLDFLIPPDEHPSPYSEKCDPNRKKGNAYEGRDDAYGKSSPYETESNPQYTNDGSSNPPTIREQEPPNIPFGDLPWRRGRHGEVFGRNK
jgi:hypothetical protein